jgi:hypothetical protein
MSQAREWEISGYDGTTLIFRTRIPSGQITRDQLCALLRTLTAKHGLTDAELALCFLRRGTKAHLPHLEVRAENHDDTRATTYSCGSNPHFVASLRSLKLTAVDLAQQSR